VAEHFVLKVPDTLDLAGAAPLLCAGITTWSPLRHWKVGTGSHVAIVGLGGLGHMGLKLAKAMGAEVMLFSRSPGKEADARRLGADHIVISTDPAQMAAVAGHFDLIIDTVPYQHDVNPYVPTLAANGTIVLVGYLGPLEPALNSGPLVFSRKSLAGSLIGGLAETQEMLDFCGEHGIHSDIEVIRIQDINEAYERMLKADVKYRFVIDMASLKERVVA
jgi:alcohol dehydrogenase (NADP+)